MKAYTDYPFTFLGDESGKEAPLRQVMVLDWDGNKYARIVVPNEKVPEGLTITSIKTGYLYSSKMCGPINKNELDCSSKHDSWNQVCPSDQFVAMLGNAIGWLVNIEDILNEESSDAEKLEDIRKYIGNAIRVANQLDRLRPWLKPKW